MEIVLPEKQINQFCIVNALYEIVLDFAIEEQFEEQGVGCFVYQIVDTIKYKHDSFVIIILVVDEYVGEILVDVVL
jgi:hypothetical protein